MDDNQRRAERFADLFGEAYFAFHRRDAPRSELSGASRAVLTHLAMTGPVTVGEAAVHLDRAQSVVSEIVTRLESHGLLEREPDPADHRRTLVWLTAAGHGRLKADREVLSTELVARGMAAVPGDRMDAALDAFADLIAGAIQRDSEHRVDHNDPDPRNQQAQPTRGENDVNADV